MAHQIGYWALVAVGFGFLIFVHELGHFLACKCVGVRVVRFALGFGPRLFGTKIGETDYCVCLIPCGGYLKMAGGEGEGAEDATGAPDEFPAKTPGQRALVVMAGPFMSILAAVPLLFGLLLAGMERPSPRINLVLPGMPAWRAGLKRGDLITGLRRRNEDSWREIRLWREVKFNAALGDKVGDIVVRVERDGREREFELTTEKKGFMGVTWGSVGGSDGYLTTVAGRVPRGSAPEQAGIVPGSQMLEIAGRKIHTWDDVETAVLAKPNSRVPVKFTTPDGQTRTSTVAIGMKEYWGLGILAYRPTRVRLVRPKFPAAKAGLEPGDRIVAVNDQVVHTWPDIERRVVDAAPGEIRLRFVRNEETKEASVELEAGDEVGDVLGIAPEEYPVVTGFVHHKSDNTAEKAGIKVGAKLLKVQIPGSSKRPLEFEKLNQRQLLDRVQFLAWSVEETKSLEVTYEQDGKERTVLVPLIQGELGVLDLSPRLEKCRAVEPWRPLAALRQAFVETGGWLRFAGKGLWLLVRGRISLRMLSGPVMILTATRYQAEAGFAKFIEFLVIITVHLGLINLVPFPILDGGHILFLLVEKVRRKPLPEKVMAGLMYGGMVALIALMIFVTGNDILQLVRLINGS